MNQPSAEDRNSRSDSLTLARRWKTKFAAAFSGLVHGTRGHSSFLVHVPVALAVLGLAAVLQAASWQWAVLLICITGVLVAEFFNSAIETLVRRIHPEHDREIGKALDISAAAVFVASLGAMIVGAMVLLPLIFQQLFS